MIRCIMGSLGIQQALWDFINSVIGMSFANLNGDLDTLVLISPPHLLTKSSLGSCMVIRRAELIMRAVLAENEEGM